MIELIYDNDAQRADLVRKAGGKNLVASDDRALETAVFISLFTDRRASDEESALSGSDKRGWWGDSFADVPGDLSGSRLWLLRRMSQADALRLAPGYAEEALAWLMEDGAAKSVIASASVLGPGALYLNTRIERPGEIGPWERLWKVRHAV
jgi:phage gp46-like protein